MVLVDQGDVIPATFRDICIESQVAEIDFTIREPYVSEDIGGIIRFRRLFEPINLSCLIQPESGGVLQRDLIGL